MKTLPRSLPLFLLLLLFVVPEPSHALITGDVGNRPVHDRAWPEGTLQLANLKIRLGWWEGPPFGGGEYHFLYRGDTKAFADSLDKFSKINTPEKVLVIHEGAQSSFWLRNEKDASVNWELTVWSPQNWHQLYNDPTSYFSADRPHFRQPVAPPKLDVYLTGSIDWSKITVPPGITIIDRRLSSVGLDASEGAVVQGQVFDMQTSKPIVDAELILEPRQDKTTGTLTRKTIRSNQRGEFDLRKIPPATYQLLVQAEGYASRQLGHEAIGKQTLLTYKNIQLVKATSIAGRLLDNSGISIANAKVRMRNPMAIDGRGYSMPVLPTTTTDENGEFSFDAVPTGFTQFFCSAEGYHFSDLFSVHKVPGVSPELKMSAAGSIQVKVLDQDGLPLIGDHIISIEPEGDPIGKWGGSAKVDTKAGKNIFQRVPPGKYKVEAHPNGRSVLIVIPSKWIEVTSSKQVVVELQYKAKNK